MYSDAYSDEMPFAVQMAIEDICEEIIEIKQLMLAIAGLAQEIHIANHRTCDKSLH